MRDETIITDPEETINIKTYEKNGLTYIPTDYVMRFQVNATISMEMAHRRFGHASDERLVQLERNTKGLRIEKGGRRFCDTCATAKSNILPFPNQRQTMAKAPFEIISSDLKGPLLETSEEGYKYFITFNCQYSTWCGVDLLRGKTGSEVLSAVKRFFIIARSETKKEIRTFLTDNGSEYDNQAMAHYLEEQGVRHMKTIPYSPQQNGQAERRNQTLMAMARCAIIESKVSHKLWHYAVKFAAYTLNRLPTKRIEWRTPFELWTGRKPELQKPHQQIASTVSKK
jgi:IS30 family transposase